MFCSPLRGVATQKNINKKEGAPKDVHKQVRKKLLSKTCWFKKRLRRKDSKDMEDNTGRVGSKSQEWGSNRHTRSYLWISPQGELARKMREVMHNMEQTVGYRIKVAERTGRTLGSMFTHKSLGGSTIWEE